MIKLNTNILLIALAALLILTSASEYLSLILIEHGYVMSLLWFCHILAYILAAGSLLRSSLLSSIALISAIPTQFMWIVDFIQMLLFNSGSRTAWMFANDLNAWWIPHLSLLLHIIIIPISIYAVFKFGFHKRSIFYALAISTIVLFLTFIFTEPYININCVFYPCDLNWQTHSSLINYNKFYGSTLYFIKELLFWYVVGTLVYLIVLRLAKKIGVRILN